MLTLLPEICMGLIFGPQFLTVTNLESTVTIGKKVIPKSTRYLYYEPHPLPGTQILLPPPDHSDQNPGAMTPHKSWEFNSLRSLHSAPSSPTPLPHLSSLLPWFLAIPLNLLPSHCSTL